jgi:hypothetical protein
MSPFVIKAVKLAKPLMVGVAGAAIVLAGIVMLVLPMPGIPLVLAGLAVLATEFAWARNLLAAVRKLIAGIRARRASRGPGSELRS